MEGKKEGMQERAPHDDREGKDHTGYGREVFLQKCIRNTQINATEERQRREV